MRLAYAVIGLAAFGLARTASGDEISVARVSFAPTFQGAIDNDIGAGQGDALRARVERAIGAALVRRGATMSANAPTTISVEIVDAVPNRVTIQHLRKNYLLDPGATVQLGGAELHAVLRSAGGQTLAEVEYSRYDREFADLVGPPAMWTSADRTIAQFAERVADAYVAQNSAR